MDVAICLRDCEVLNFADELREAQAGPDHEAQRRLRQCLNAIRYNATNNSLPFQERGDGKCLKFQMSRPGIEPGTRCLKGIAVPQRVSTDRGEARDFPTIRARAVSARSCRFSGVWSPIGHLMTRKVTGRVRRRRARVEGGWWREAAGDRGAVGPRRPMFPGGATMLRRADHPP
jgi:hypothetical protein